MTIIVTVWVILITASQHVESDNVIIVNNSGRSDCCETGGQNCTCNSLSNALQYLEDNTMVNITSESVRLDNATVIGSGKVVTNITIIGNNTIVTCNNTGSVSCTRCVDFVIEGITWDQCGNINAKGGIYFTNSSNITIDNCTFQNSQTCAVSLLKISYDIIVTNSYFISNGAKEIPSADIDNVCSGLKIDTAVTNTTVMISGSIFSDNGNFTNRMYDPVYGCIITSEVDIKLTISKTKFLTNSGGMYLYTSVDPSDNVTLTELVVSHNTNEGIKIKKLSAAKGNLCLNVFNSTFSDNGNGGIVGDIYTFDPNTEITVVVDYINFTDNRAVNSTNGALMIAISSASNAPCSVYVQHSNFMNNSNGTIYVSTSQGTEFHLVHFYEVVVEGCVTMGSSSGSGTVYISLFSSVRNTYNFYSVIFSSNKYIGINGGALFLKTPDTENDVFLINCVFINNIGSGEGAAFYYADGVTSNLGVYDTRIELTGVNFTDNKAGNSIVYVAGGSIDNSRITVQHLQFVNNTGTSLHLIMSKLTFSGYALFENNTANTGAALYLEQGTQVYFDHKHESVNVEVEFVNNTATQYGGAIYADVPSTCATNGVMFHVKSTQNYYVFFMNSKSGISGNVMYFNIHEHCEVNTNVSNSNSLLYLPYKFNYSEPHSTLNRSIVTSPNSVMLYFPNHDGSYIGTNTVFISDKILGKAIRFNGVVFDYFNNSAEPTQFHIQCINGCVDYTLADNRLLVDNVSLLSIILSGRKIDFSPINITLGLTSILPSFNQQISLQLIIELQQCFSGYYYNVHFNQCVCYNHKDIVQCYDDYNEIKRGYWFGTVTDPSISTVSLCPSRYCDFGNSRKETRQGYCIIPRRLDDQCNRHRTGVACGKCKSEYTLAYDSPDCINKDKCSAGMTILVIVLTILYWIAIVAVVFGLMYFQFQISSGYAYGIIYFYSVIDILSVNNPYVSDAVFQVIAILASFAKLTPQLFGQLCLVEGLSGIDQQFIHYSHALAVSLILLIIVQTTKYSSRLALYVRRCIIRIICLLLLLSYTSLASTSLQLLRAVHYPGYDGLYVYLSPDMKYFSNRHAFYGVVAVLCGVVIVVGLPLFLLLEPLILSRWFNFIKIKPLLDQFQGCYKDKHRWFASYYLICRQIIILIVYFGNTDNYEMLYFLQTACVVIAMFHIWIQPYTDDFLNAFDGIVLLTLVLIVHTNTLSFLSSATSVVIIILILLPLFALCLTGSKKLVSYILSRRQQQYDLIDYVDNSYSDEKDDPMNYGRYKLFVVTIRIVFSECNAAKGNWVHVRSELRIGSLFMGRSTSTINFL